MRLSGIASRVLLTFTLAAGGVSVAGQEVFFFRDSNTPGYYDSGLAFKTTPSSLEQTGPSGDKIPTDNTAFQGSNSLRIRWTSRSGGDWSALVIAPGFPFQDITGTDTLGFWAYSLEGLPKAQMPVVFLEGAPGATKSRKYPLGNYNPDLPAKVWTFIKVPLSALFQDPAQTGINFKQTKAIILGQNSADGAEHTLLIDEVKTYRSAGSGDLTPPASLAAKGYDRHIEIRWPAAANPPLNWRIYRSADNGQTFTPLKVISGKDSLYIDFFQSPSTIAYQYRVHALNSSGQESLPSPVASATLQPMSDEQLLDMVQAYTFRYFWDFAHPVSGLSRERNTSGNLVTIGGSGFGVMAIIVAIERGYITRAQGLARLRRMVNFLSTADRFKGVFPHWMDGTTGKVIPFSTKDNGGDLVETAFLFQGLLTARAYFDRSEAEETQLRNQITTLWQEVDWNWYRKQNQNVLYWHWSPNYQFDLNLAVKGWNETLIIYLLAIASPTNPVPASLWDSGWASNGGFQSPYSYYGHRLFLGNSSGGPLFFTHYSFLGFDPRNRRDKYVNYFEQNRNQSLINRAYCVANPKKFQGYGPDCWGLTASDDPQVGYRVHEPDLNGDNGTITPTAALSSMPYTPAESIAALKYFYRELGARLWGPMGFYDAFNLSLNWYADSYLAIDQGPIIGMIENYRTGLLWTYFMKNQEIKDALGKIGFTDDVTTVEELVDPSYFQTKLAPNPVATEAELSFRLDATETMSIDLLDLSGRVVKTWLRQERLTAGEHRLSLSLKAQAAGQYYLRLRTRDKLCTQPLIIQP